MSIKRTIITTVVALALVAVVAPGVAQGDQLSDLLAQIAQLQAQILALQGGSAPTGGVPAACAGVTFSRNLTVGSTGSDVKCLQALLNTSASTQVATTGAGAPGYETTYFGTRTLAAVKIFQQQHGWVPANQVGPLTRNALNAMLTGGVVVTPGQPPVVPTGAGLTVALAANNPATGTIVDGQAQAQLAKLTFTNGDSSEVKVTVLKLKRIGISADASLTNVYLFDGATRITDGSAVSSTVVNFNNSSGLFTVPAYGSKTITVTSDVDGASGETVGVQVVASTDVTSNSSSIKGSFPITGNLMTIATGTLAGVNFNTTTTPSDATIDPQDDYTVWQNSVSITTRSVDLTRISFRKTGSVKDADLQNFRMYIDGVQVGSAIPNITLSANSESLVTFDLTASPKRLEAGTRVIKLLANIVGGSSLTFQFHLWNVADATFVDTQYGANVLPLANSLAFSKRSAGTSGMTVGSGTITITKMSDSPTGNIVNLATAATLAKFQLKAAGERVKIETLYVSVRASTGTVSGLRNGFLLANGVQVGSTTTLYDPEDITYEYTTFNLGSSLIVAPGSPVTLEVKADVYDTGSSDTTNNIIAGTTTLQVVIEGSTSWNNGTGLVSASTLDVPASDVNGNSLTVAAGGLTLSKDTAYSDHSVVAPLTAYKVGDFNLAANTTEAVNITAINVLLDEVSSYATNLYVKYGTKETSTKATVDSTGTNTWSINETLAAGTTLPIEVYMDVSNLMTTGSGLVVVDVDGTTVSSGASADSTVVNGQTLTYTAGAFATAFASTPQSQTVAGGQTVEAGRWKFTSSYDAYTIEEIKIDPDVAATSNGAAEDAISSAILKDGTTVLATQSFNNIDTNGTTGGFYFTGLSILIPASTSKTLTVDFVLATPSSTNSTDGLRIVPALTYTKFRDSQGTVDTSVTERDGNSTYVFKTVPTITKEALTSTTLINVAAVDLFKFRVAAPVQGDVSIKQFKLDLSWSDGGAAAPADVLLLDAVKLYKDGVDITTSVLIHEEDTGNTVEETPGLSEGNSKIIVTWTTDTEDTIQAGSSTVYTIRATPNGFNTTDNATFAGSDSIAISFNTDAADVSYGSTTLPFIGYLNIGTTKTSVLKTYGSTTAALGRTANVLSDDANLIWSDNSAVAHSAAIDETATQTGDWTNSYLLKSSLTPQAWTD